MPPSTPGVIAWYKVEIIEVDSYQTAQTSAEEAQARQKLARQQTLRLRLVGQAALTYVIDASLLALFAAAHITSFAVSLGAAALGVLFCGGAALAIWRGWNLRFKDPSLTLPQMTAGLATQMSFLAWAPEVGFLFLLALFNTLSIGALQLTLRQFIGLSIFCMLGCGVAIFISGERLAFPVATPLQQGLVWLGFAAVLFRYTYVHAYVSGLREILHQRNKQLASSNEQISLMAEVDELTKVYNRRRMMTLLLNEIKRVERNGPGFCIAMLDVDHFKNVNDSFGHLKGDEVLKEFAEIVQANLRATDKLSRYGGEEFLVLLTATSPEVAPMVAERLRVAVACKDWGKVATGLNLTVSIGFTAFRKGETIEQLVGRTDVALYAAKHAGRNRVVEG